MGVITLNTKYALPLEIPLTPQQADNIFQILKRENIDKNEYEYSDSLIYEEEKIIPKSLTKTEDFFEKHKDKIDEIYEWYSTAIQRRNREPLPRENFIYHFFGGGNYEQSYIYGNFNHGFALGYYRHGIFIPTHFAPRTLKGGYKLMKELGKSKNTPSVLAITDDLAATLKKIPTRHIEDVGIEQYYGGELTKKQIAYNSHPNILNLLPKLVEDYLQEQENRDEYDNDDYYDDYSEFDDYQEE